jgi:hypothetical protein
MATTRIHKYWTILDFNYCIYEFDNMEDAELFEELAHKRFDEWGTHYAVEEFNLEQSKQFLKELHKQQCDEEEYWENRFKE